MSANVHEGRERVDTGATPTTTGRRRSIWIIGLVAAVVVVAVVGVITAMARSGTSHDAASTTSASSMTGSSYSTSSFQPAFTWNVPAWAAGPGVVVSDAPADLSWKKPEGCDPRCEWMGFLRPQSVKQWSTGDVLPVATAAQYADYLRQMGKGGPIIIRSEKPITVGGMAGTEFTFDERAFTPDAFACIDAKGTDCYPTSSDMTTTAVVLDAGGRTLVGYTSGLSINPDGDLYRQQFERALSTLDLRQAAAAPVTYPVDATQLSPEVTAQLPSWVATAQAVGTGADGYTFGQQVCDRLCPNGHDRSIGIFHVPYMYPLDGTHIASPPYLVYTVFWRQIQQSGYGTVSDVAQTKVGGRTATTMTVRISKQINGLVRCGAATDRKNEGGCFGLIPGLTLHLSIVNQGQGKPPTLLYESHNTANTQDEQDVATEFATWLSTVAFP